MEEIKFAIWNSTENKMYDNIALPDVPDVFTDGCFLLRRSDESDFAGKIFREGDVTEHETLEYKAMVLFKNGMFCLSNNVTQPLFAHGFNTLKILGNRFENPELLTDIEIIN